MYTYEIFSTDNDFPKELTKKLTYKIGDMMPFLPEGYDFTENRPGSMIRSIQVDDQPLLTICVQGYGMISGPIAKGVNITFNSTYPNEILENYAGQVLLKVEDFTADSITFSIDCIYGKTPDRNVIEYDREDIDEYLDDCFIEGMISEIGEPFSFFPLEEKDGYSSIVKEIKKIDADKFELILDIVRIKGTEKESYSTSIVTYPGAELELNLLELQEFTEEEGNSDNPCLVKIIDINENSVTTKIVGVDKEFVKLHLRNTYGDKDLLNKLIILFMDLEKGDSEGINDFIGRVERTVKRRPETKEIITEIKKLLIKMYEN